MIYFVTHAEGRHAIALLLASWGRDLAERVRMADYRVLLRKRRIPLGSYIFTGLEHLSDEQLEQTARMWDTLRAASADVLLCNHPLRMLRRYALLRLLNEEGINPFNVYRLDECRRPEIFPVFLRRANDHAGPRSELLRDPAEFERAVTALLEQGICLNDWIVTEFGQVRGSDGLYRKYGAFLINGRIIPRHLHIDRDWIIKRAAAQITPEMADEEWSYVQDNPHAAELREIFAAARIDYGRIDYTIGESGIRVFEINTNPQILTPGESRDVSRRRVKRLFAERLIGALREAASVEHPSIYLRVDRQHASLLQRRPPFTEMGIRFTNRLGLKRFEPTIYRGLVAFRKFWR